MTLKWANPNHDRFKRSQKEERRVAAAHGGRALPRSGGMSATVRPGGPTLGGDVRSSALLMEHKRTDCPSMSVPFAWFATVSRGADRMQRAPAVVLLFEILAGVEREWIFLALPYFQSVTGCREATERYTGTVRDVHHQSFTLKARELTELVAAAGDRTPTLAVVWHAQPRIPVWIGMPHELALPFFRGDDA